MHNLILIALTLTLTLTLKLNAQDPGTVHHPVPKPPKYLRENLYSSLKASVPVPPKAGSAEQKQDEEKLNHYQKTRTPKDCERAKTEVFVSLGNFFGPEHGLLDSGAVQNLTGFFEQLRNDGDFFVQKLKKDFPRQRPFLYLSSIEPCVPKEVTGAYPSGHAILSRLYALVLSDLYPDQKDKFISRADQIAEDRVISGMHHPTDIESGKKVGEWLFQEFKKSAKFEADLGKFRKSR